MAHNKAKTFAHLGKGDISRQVVLPFKKSLEISLKSLKSRFFRNLITVLSLVLAVSFLAYVFISNDIANGLFHSGNPANTKMLLRAGFDLPDPGGHIGGSAKERWIVILSLLVCTVGIINAQLMSVTERFREIGTMKCLGALNSFVLRLFLIEAGFQGLAGAFAGSVAGLVFALVVGLIRFGTAAITNLSFLSITGSILVSVGIGLGLTLVGVFYPAIVAARMRPVEAMRTEQ